MENIKILGTGSSTGIPHPYCSCNYCEKVKKSKGKDIRKRSGVKLSDSTLIEFSPDIRSHILENDIDFDKVKNILITHTHNDHLDTQELIRVKRDINVYINSHSVEWLKAELERGVKPKHKKNKHEILLHNIIPMKFFIPVEVADYKVTPIKANHTGLCKDEIAMNFYIEKNNSNLLYASDTGIYPLETMNFFKGKYLNKMIVECTFLSNLEKENSHHLNFNKLRKVLIDFEKDGIIDSNTEICVTHFGHDGFMQHNEIEDEFSKWNYSILVAYDGMMF